MRKEIETKVKGLFDAFVGDLDREHKKYIAMQKNLEATIGKHAEEESLRKEQFKESMTNLDGQKQKVMEEKERYEKQIDKLQKETQEYNKLNSGIMMDKKETEKNRNESEELKRLDAKQLKKNKEIEIEYDNKIKFLQEDANNNVAKEQKLNRLERDLGIKEKSQNKKDKKHTEEYHDLNERKKKVEVGEERARLKDASA